jgi:hypothetical protein
MDSFSRCYEAGKSEVLIERYEQAKTFLSLKAILEGFFVVAFQREALTGL